MKIAIFVGTFPTVSETFILEEICQLIDAGHEVIIFALFKGDSENGGSKYKYYKLSERTYYFTKLPYGKFKAFLKISYLLLTNFKISLTFVKKYKSNVFSRDLAYYLTFLHHNSFDILHCHFVNMGDFILSLRKKKIISGKLVTSFHGSDLTSQYTNKGIFPNLIKEGEKFISNSSFTTNVAIKKGYPADKITCIPASFNLQNFQPVSDRVYPKEKIIIISVCRLIPLKGISYGIKAMHHLIGTGIKNFEYRIIGEGPLRENLSQEIIHLGLQDHVCLLGSLPNDYVKKEFENADIFIMPGIVDEEGRAEAQGIVLQEAQAMGLPVIASRVGGMAEGLKENISGFLVKEKDEIAIAEKLLWFINDQLKIAEFGKEGQRFVKEYFDPNKNIYKLIKCYEEIIN